jgi:hypothetical protein
VRYRIRGTLSVVVDERPVTTSAVRDRTMPAMADR